MQKIKSIPKGVQIMKEITYRQVGDYLIPNLTLPKEEKKPLGKYGTMRMNYLKNHRKVFFDILLTKGELMKHIYETQETASQMMEQLTEQMMKSQGVTEELKESNQMLWVQMMNNIKHSAEEIVLNELIYA